MREPPNPPNPVTRLAPSPTGSLHLGNAFSFVINWAIARKRNWRIILRIEDLDHSRVRPGMVEQCIDTLRWLGLDWDEPPTMQRDHTERFEQAMHQLARAGRVYPCELSHKQIREALNAPHLGDAPDADAFDAIRPNPLPHAFDNPDTSWRFVLDAGTVAFRDANMGPQSFDASALGGDFIVWTKRRTPSYQLAVVVDDHAAGVTQVVRGRDLLDSAARQLLLYRALGLSPEPTYTHLPLILGPDSRRLAKRDADTHVRTYSAMGGPERVIGLIAHWAGAIPEPRAMTLDAFLEAFDPDTLPVNDIVFREEDAQWLRS